MSLTPALNDRKSHAFLMEALDAKQRIYVDARALGSLPVQAARCAGYNNPDDAAYTLEQDSTVRMAVEVTIRLRAREHQITREDVLAMLQDAYRNAATSTEMVAAAREIGKLLGHYEPQKIDINKSVEIKQQQIRNMSDEELLKLSREVIDGDYQLLDFDRAPEPVHAQT